MGIEETAGPPQYRIVIRGELSDRLGSAFPGTALERRDGRTVLRGRADDAQLEQLLERLRDLGIEPVTCDVER